MPKRIWKIAVAFTAILAVISVGYLIQQNVGSPMVGASRPLRICMDTEVGLQQVLGLARRQERQKVVDTMFHLGGQIVEPGEHVEILEHHDKREQGEVEGIWPRLLCSRGLDRR